MMSAYTLKQHNLAICQTLQIYYHFQRTIPSVAVSKPSKSPALIPIFLPKTSIRRIALLLLLLLGANLFLQRWKLSVPTKLLTHFQWRCQFLRPRHCGLDNLIGEARRCVPGRGIQMLYQRLSQCWLLSCCGVARSYPLLLLDPSISSPSPAGWGKGWWGWGVGGGQAPERDHCWRVRPCGLKVSDRLFQRDTGEGCGGPTCTALPGSRPGGRHKISQQIMKLSLIAAERVG